MSAYSDLVLADGPSFLFPMRDAGAQTNLTGGVSLSDPGGANAPSFQVDSSPFNIPGEAAQCTYFDGSSGTKFMFGDNASSEFDLGAGDYTLECWFSWDFGTGDYKTIMRRDYTSGSFILRLTPAGRLEGFAGGLCTGADVLSQDTWYHGVFVRSGTQGTLYLNGVQIATAGSQAGGSGGVNGMIVGCNHSGAEKYQGGLAWMAGYKRALTEGEVLEHYRVGTGLSTEDRFPFLGGIVVGGRQHPTLHLSV